MARDEPAYTREMLDRRYDDLESGKVKLIRGDEVKARLRGKERITRHLVLGCDDSAGGLSLKLRSPGLDGLFPRSLT